MLFTIFMHATVFKFAPWYKLCFVVKCYYSKPLHQHVSRNMGASSLSDMSLVG